MTALDVLNTIRQAGGRVVVLDGDLRIVAPPGTLTKEAATVLLAHKEALISILPDGGREAIQWSEGLDPAEAKVVVETARREFGEIVNAGSTPVAEPGDPDHDLNAWAEKQVGDAETLDPDEEPVPCPTCGEIAAWWDPTGKRHCMACEPTAPQKAQQLVTKAQRLREKGKFRFTIGGKAPKPAPAPWPPADMQLPDDLAKIEQGRPQTPAPARDDTQSGRLRRLLAPAPDRGGEILRDRPSKTVV